MEKIQFNAELFKSGDYDAYDKNGEKGVLLKMEVEGKYPYVFYFVDGFYIESFSENGLCQLTGEVDLFLVKKGDVNECATKKQVGGSHYKDFPIQPIEFIVKNKLDWFQGNIVKYTCRHAMKNGKQDLEKVIHYAQLAIEHYYGLGDND